MKILHLIASLAPSQGGPSVSCPSLAAAQAMLGHQVSIAYPADVQTQTEIESVGTQTVANFSALNLVPLPIDKPAWLVMIRWLDEHLADFDFVHVHGIWSLCLVGALRRCIAGGVPYAVAPRGMLDYWSMKQRWFKKKVAWHLLWKPLLNRATFVHALNDDERMALMQFRLRAPILVSPNGIARSMLAEIDKVSPKPSDSRYVLFISRLHHKKGLDYLASALASVLSDHPSVRLKVAGPDEGALSKFVEQCRSLRIENQVDLLGPVYGTQKYALIKGCSVFCLPSRQEGFSVMLAEVLACARPVVISRQCNFPEVGLSRAGRVVELDVVAIAQALRVYIDDPVLADTAGQFGRTLVESDYTWEVIAAQMIGLYQKSLRPVLEQANA